MYPNDSKAPPFLINDPMLSDVSNQWEQYYSKLKNSLSGTEIQKQQIIRKRILKFFGEYRLNSQSYFFPRRNIDLMNPQLRFVYYKLIIFGIDYLTRQKMLQYLKGFQIELQFIDDSHCLVNFSNKNECLQALSKKNKNQIIFKSENEVINKSQDGWIQLQPYYEILFQRKIMVRYYSNFDHFQATKNQKQTHHAYLKAKKKFLKFIKDSHDKQFYSLEQTTSFNKNRKRKNRRSNSRKYSKDSCCLSNIYQECSHMRNFQNGICNCIRMSRNFCHCQRSRSRQHQCIFSSGNLNSRSRSRNKNFALRNQLQFDKYCQIREDKLRKKQNQRKQEIQQIEKLEQMLNINSSHSKNCKPFESKIPAINSKSGKNVAKYQEQEDDSFFGHLKRKDDDMSIINYQISRFEL